MIKSKFSIYAYLVAIGILAFIWLGAYFLTHPQILLPNKSGDTNSAVVPGLALIAMGFFLYWIVRSVFFLTIDRSRLIIFSNFSRHTIERAQIHSIILTDRRSVSGNRADVLSLEMTDGRLFILPDQFCRN